MDDARLGFATELEESAVNNGLIPDVVVAT
jgi:hypothetical protein